MRAHQCPSFLAVAVICDFCNAPHPPWAYPATDARVPGTPLRAIGHWLACDICAALIDAGDKPGLAARSRLTYRPRPVPPLQAFLELHEHCFWTHRTGPCVPATKEVLCS